jgi:transposase
LENLSNKFSLGKPIVVADAGLLSEKNRKSLENSGYKYILGARIKNEKGNLKQQILALNLQGGQNAVIKKGDKTRLVVSQNDKRTGKDRHNRKKGLLRLRKRIECGKLTKSNINNRGYNKYLKLEGEIKISIDEQKYALDAAWDGLKGYITNTRLSAKQIIENYGNLWYIERAFRMNKTDLRIRPIYHHLRNRIEGHICICFTAYTVLLELERMLKRAKSEITVKRAQELVKKMYQLVYRLPRSRESRTKILNIDAELWSSGGVTQNNFRVSHCGKQESMPKSTKFRPTPPCAICRI